MAITKVNNAMQDALAAAQPTITSVGTLTGLDVNGTATMDRLGLGVAAHASAALHITTTEQHIRFNNGSELATIYLDSDGKLNIWAHGDGETINLKTGTGSGTDVLSVVGNNVGIGTSSPDTLVHAYKASNAILKVEEANGYASLQQSGVNSYLNNIASGGSLIFRNGTGNTERMRLSGGNLLVGKTTTAIGTQGIRLEGSNGKIEATRSGNVVTTFNRTSSDGPISEWMKDGTTVGSIGVSGGNNLFISGQAASHAGLTFATQSVLPTSQGAINNNTVDLGQSGNAFKDLYLSSGVYLGGTGAANKLSDFETGVFTATLRGSTGQPNPLITTTAKYTKVGDTVNVWVSFESVNTTGYSGTVTITGLPFTNNGGRVPFAAVPYVSTTWNSGYQVTGFIQHQSTTLNIYQFGSGSPYAGAIHAAGGNKYWWCQATYKT